jgi:hypothetical protein
MTTSEESNRFRKTAAGHLRKARAAKTPDEKEHQSHIADGYKKLAESDELLAELRKKTPKASPGSK